MKTLFFFLLLLFVSLPTRAQYSVVSRFPYTLHNNQSNAKILDLGNNHLIFIMANDSLFVSHSYDNGSTWEDPITVLTGYYNSHIDGIVLPTGRIVIEFFTFSIYSDDNGITWSSPENIGTRPSAREKKLYYSDELYAFMKRVNKLSYWTSANGTNWLANSEINDIAPFGIESFSFVDFSPGNYIVALAGSESDTYSIILKKSASLYGNWTDLGTAFESSNSISDIDGIKDSSGKFWISFTMSKTVDQRTIKNVYYITSEDSGTTWSEPVPFGKSYRDDWNTRLSLSDDNPFAVFLTNRENIQGLPYFGKLGISEDLYPPFLQDNLTHLSDNYPNTVTVIAKARAFTDQLPLTVSLTYNGEPIETMYDDGQHNDGIAGDSIYGASHTFNYSDISDGQALIGLSASDVHQTTTSLQLFSLNPHVANGWDIHVIRNGNTKFAFKSNGIIADIGSYTPQTTYDGTTVMYSGGFMMSGKTNGEIWSNGMATSSRIQDYVGGTIGDTSKGFYIVKSSDPAFGESWQNWSNAVAKGAYYYDGNGDGVYNPVDLNSNGQWDWDEDCPDILGDETVWSVYNDGVPAEERRIPDVSPQGIEIRQTVWTKYNDDLNKNVYYIRYSIVNRGTVADTLKDVYFGLWSDNDIGYYNDDLAGCSIPTRTGYTYNGGEDPIFGVKVPVVMGTFLQGPIRYTGNSNDDATNNMGNILGIQHISGAVNDTMTSFTQYMNGVAGQSDPNTKEEVRYYLLGENQSGEIVNPCDWMFGTVEGGADCSTIDGKFMYSGDPTIPYGWINTALFDQRMMINTGPFNLVTDQPVDIITAYHFSRGETSLESVALGLEKAADLQYNFPILGVENRGGDNVVREFKLEQNYPNPFSKGEGNNPSTVINFSIPKTANVLINVYNILGQKVTTLVNKRLAPGKYKTKFNGKNLSSGIYFYFMQSGDFTATKKMILLK